jgi:hypothetical protein
MVLAFLIREKGMSYEEAYRVVKSRRSIVIILAILDFAK